MKLLALSVIVAGLGFLSSGCVDVAATPGYSGQERAAQISRNISYDWEQLADDTDHALLLRPASRNTIWNVYHRD